MGYKYHWLHFFIQSILLTGAQKQTFYVANFCYDATSKSRGNTYLFFFMLIMYMYEKEKLKIQVSFIRLDFLYNVHTKPCLA